MKFGLALSGGATRGAAHIGALKQWQKKANLFMDFRTRYGSSAVCLYTMHKKWRKLPFL